MKYIFILVLALSACGVSQAPPAVAPLTITKTVYVPWTFPPDLVNVPPDPAVTPWVMQSDAAHAYVALKSVADTCRLIHAASVAASVMPVSPVSVAK